MNTFRSVFSSSFKRFKDSDVHDLGAALSFFTIFSLVPLISVIVLIVGFFLDRNTAMVQLIIFFRETAGQGVASFIQQMIESNNTSPASIAAAVLAFIVLIYAVTNLTSQLQDSLNRILDCDKEELSFWKGIEDRIMSFSIVLLQSFVLTAFFIISIGVSVFETRTSHILHLSPDMISLINLGLTFLLITCICFITFRYLPHTRKSFKAIAIGSLVSSLLFILGKYLISLYLAYADPGVGYGVAGTLIVILLWIYYSAQIIFFGACVAFALDEK